jgi:hypothetical protein
MTTRATAEADPCGMTSKKGNCNSNCTSPGNCKRQKQIPFRMMSRKDNGNGDSYELDGVFEGAFGGQRDHEAGESAEEHA